MTASVSAVSFCAFRMSTGQPLSKSSFTTSSCPLNAWCIINQKDVIEDLRKSAVVAFTSLPTQD